MSKEKDALGDRMKGYESRGTGARAMKGIPLLARLDGRSFHSFTKGLQRPFDERLSRCMIETVKYLVEETHASVGYTQSDEISLAWFVSEDGDGEYMFDGKFSKLNSVLAAMASVCFSRLVAEHIPEKANKLPVFDCRTWQVPTLKTASEAFLWRELDATKNSISMAAHAYFSHKSLHGLNGSQKQERLFQEKGINWNNYPDFFKRGTYVKRVSAMRELSEEERMQIPEKHRPPPGHKFMRSSVKEVVVPPARKVANYPEFLFFDVAPESIT